ncbi:MAG: DUF433 domain-containing protein [Candidatus Poribacteria bacterium]|nr:DUF433 domain-containing protein [Candidatus Poribacteria bacterium]
MPIQWRDHIVSTPDILRGKPRIKGTRIPVSLLLGYLAVGYTTDEIIAEFPDLKALQIQACLDYARELADFEEVAYSKFKK